MMFPNFAEMATMIPKMEAFANEFISLAKKMDANIEETKKQQEVIIKQNCRILAHLGMENDE